MRIAQSASAGGGTESGWWRTDARFEAGRTPGVNSCAVGRSTISLMSTSAGYSMAKAMARATDGVAIDRDCRDASQHTRRVFQNLAILLDASTGSWTNETGLICASTNAILACV
jgi:hypothetical protein